jgi:ParB-like chromosome segregation protein Spo0J
MKVELWPISRPKPYGKNPRRISERAIAKVAASIKQFGFRQPLVCDAKSVIIVGHKRLLGAKKLGLKQIPVTIAEDLSPAQVKAYRIADNRTADETDWDNELLADELADLNALDFDLSATGFDPFELTALRDPTGPDATLATSFLVNPYSILDSRKRWWKDRRKAWMEVGVDAPLDAP